MTKRYSDRNPPVESRVLLPPLPDERSGWGRFRHIWASYPTATIELFAGFMNVARGVYVTLPGHHDSLPGFPSPERLMLALVMAALGVGQIWSCLYEWAVGRALSAVLLTGLLSYLTFMYALQRPYTELAGTVMMFYFLFVLAEFWIAARTPPLFPLASWVDRVTHRFPDGGKAADARHAEVAT